MDPKRREMDARMRELMETAARSAQETLKRDRGVDVTLAEAMLMLAAAKLSWIDSTREHEMTVGLTTLPKGDAAWLIDLLHRCAADALVASARKAKVRKMG